ncbi:MAG: energy transducer TonB [Ferruginibacter sp.]|nr:energy transducer TonB [Ferruginibacter sp.]
MLSSGPLTMHAQQILVDSLKKIRDFSDDFNGAEIQLVTVKKHPEYPGGRIAWQQFLREQIDIRVPKLNKAVPGVYNVVVRFTVGANGELRAFTPETNKGYGMETELIRCLKKSIPWIAAENNAGKKVAFTTRTLVIFHVKTNEVTLSFPAPVASPAK